MRIQTNREHDETLALIRSLRRDLKASDAERVVLADQLRKARAKTGAVQAELDAINSSVVQAHRDLLANNQQLRIANRQLHKQLEDAIGYGPAELAVIDAGGEKALAAAEREAAAAAAAVKASAP